MGSRLGNVKIPAPQEAPDGIKIESYGELRGILMRINQFVNSSACTQCLYSGTMRYDRNATAKTVFRFAPYTLESSR